MVKTNIHEFSIVLGRRWQILLLLSMKSFFSMSAVKSFSETWGSFKYSEIVHSQLAQVLSFHTNLS